MYRHRRGGCYAHAWRGAFALLFAWLCLVTPAAAQSLIEEELEQRVTEVTALLADYPRLAGLTADEKRKLVEFVTGNLLFVVGHESGHALISQLEIPVIGREEDAADSFATLMALKIGNGYAHRVLSNAATGWFYSERRDRQDHVRTIFYDEHGIGLQRAYNIVCLMVGSDPEEFGELAGETGMPDKRQETCRFDYSNASWSWDKVLEPHLRKPEQPKTEISAVYGPAEGNLAIFAQVGKQMRILESVAEMLSNQYVWPTPISLELQTCGKPDARWRVTLKKVTVCYEMVQEFAQLYRSYRKTQAFAVVDEATLNATRHFHAASE